MNVRHSHAAACVAALFIFASPYPVTLAQEITGHSAKLLVPGEQISFPSDPRLDLSREGTIEFWFRHIWDHKGAVRFAEANFYDDAYSVILSARQGSDFGFAVIVGPGARGTASLGVVADLSILTDVQALEGALVSLQPRPKNTEVLDPFPLQRNEYYHVAITKLPHKDTLEIYLDGKLQGAIAKGRLGPSGGLRLCVGGLEPSESEADDVPTLAPFVGEIAGLRLWRRRLEADSVESLRAYGRSSVPRELAMLGEYSDLVAFADFRGRWDRRSSKWVPAQNAQLRFADPLAGVWRSTDAEYVELGDSGVMKSSPSYAFVPDGIGHDHGIPHLWRYRVFEQGNYIGTLRYLRMSRFDDAGEPVHTWRFDHVESVRSPLVFDFERELLDSSRRRYRWRLSCDLPRDASHTFAERKHGERVELIRTTLADLGLESYPTSHFDPTDKTNAKATQDMTAVFLLGNNVRYKNILYRGHDFATMDRIDLTRPSSTKYVFEAPEDDALFRIDKDQIRILPVGLGIVNKNAGSTTTRSSYYSSALENSLKSVDRLGLGLSASIGASIDAKPLGVGVAVNGSLSINMGFQSDATTDAVRMSKSESELIVTNSIYKHYLLYHKLEFVRLSPEFDVAVRSLAEELEPIDDGEKRLALVHAFYEAWGTHYAAAATFGAMGWWETRLTETTAQNAKNLINDTLVKIGGGDTGAASSLGRRLDEVLRSSTKKARTLGGTKAPSDEMKSVEPGDEPVPVSFDLRPLSDLLSPQFFPDAPKVYVDLREQLSASLPYYIRFAQEKQLKELMDDVVSDSLVTSPESSFSEIEIQPVDVARFEAQLAKASGASSGSTGSPQASKQIGQIFGQFRGMIANEIATIGGRPEIEAFQPKLARIAQQGKTRIDCGAFGEFAPVLSANPTAALWQGRSTTTAHRPDYFIPETLDAAISRTTALRPTDPEIPDGVVAYFPFDLGDRPEDGVLRQVEPAPAEGNLERGAYVPRTDARLIAPIRNAASFTVHFDFKDSPFAKDLDLIRRGDGEFAIASEFSFRGAPRNYMYTWIKVRQGSRRSVTDTLAVRWGDLKFEDPHQSNLDAAGLFPGWHKLICAVDAERGTIRLWVDGRCAEGALRDSGRGEEWTIPAHERNRIDEVIVHDRALSWREIGILAQRPRTTPDEATGHEGRLATRIRESIETVGAPVVIPENQAKRAMADFHRLDANGDDVITAEEFTAAGISRKEPLTLSEVEKLLAALPPPLTEEEKETKRLAERDRRAYIAAESLVPCVEIFDANGDLRLDDREVEPFLDVLPWNDATFVELDYGRDGFLDDLEIREFFQARLSPTGYMAVSRARRELHEQLMRRAVFYVSSDRVDGADRGRAARIRLDAAVRKTNFGPRGAHLDFYNTEEVIETEALDIGDEYTMAFWVAISAGVGRIVESIDGRFTIEADPKDGNRMIYTVLGNPGPLDDASAPRLAQRGDWSHVAIVTGLSEADGHRITTIYHNGKPLPKHRELTHGLRGTLRFARGFKGQLDEIALFDRALGPEEVAILASVEVRLR